MQIQGSWQTHPTSICFGQRWKQTWRELNWVEINRWEKVNSSSVCQRGDSRMPQEWKRQVWLQWTVGNATRRGTAPPQGEIAMGYILWQWQQKHYLQWSKDSTSLMIELEKVCGYSANLVLGVSSGETWLPPAATKFLRKNHHHRVKKKGKKAGKNIKVHERNLIHALALGLQQEVCI